MHQKRYSREYLESRGVNFGGAVFIWGLPNPVETFKRVGNEGGAFLFPNEGHPERAARIARVEAIAAAVVAVLDAEGA